jgi:hypothetical protein
MLKILSLVKFIWFSITFDSRLKTDKIGVHLEVSCFFFAKNEILNPLNGIYNKAEVFN